MSFWTPVPTAVLKSKRISDGEKMLYYAIASVINRQQGKRYCTATNAQLAKALNVSESTITQRLARLIKERFANATQNPHKQERRIYLHVPGDPSLEEKLPTEEEMDEATVNLRESFKQAIIFGNVPFSVLVEKLKETPYLDDLDEQEEQFVLNKEQIRFLDGFMKYCPGKAIDCQLASFGQVNFKKLLEEIRASDFLITNNNLSLKWCVEHAAQICAGDYRKYVDFASTEKQSVRAEHDYTPAELNALFNDVDEITV